MPRVFFSLAMLAITVVAAQRPPAPDVAVVGIASLRVADLWDAAEFQAARTVLDAKSSRFQATIIHDCGLSLSEIERVTLVMFKVTAGGQDEALPPAAVIVPRKPVNVKTIMEKTGLKELVPRGKVPDFPELCILGGEEGRLVVGEKLLIRLPDLPAELPRDEMDAVMIAKSIQRDADRAAAMAKEKCLASVVLDIPEITKSYGEQPDGDGELQRLPEAVKPLLKARVLTVQFSMAKRLEIHAEASFASGETATASKAGLELMLKRLHRELDEFDPAVADSTEGKIQKSLAQWTAGLLAAASVTVTDRTAAMNAALDLTPKDIENLARGAMLLEAVAAREQSQGNLQKLVIAAHNNIVNGNEGLLENICDNKDKPLLSWRVNLLPKLGYEDLFKEFKLDEPWDSEHNKKLIPKMPKVFIVPSPRPAKEGTTYFQSFVGKKGTATRPVLQDGEAAGLSINAISDGSSVTILLVEASEAVIWTKPADILFDPDAKPPKLGGHFEGGFHAAFCDGTVKFLKNSLPEATLKALITANGGEEVTIDD